MAAVTTTFEDLVLDELERELNAQHVEVKDPQMGLSDWLGNEGKWCTLSIECMPSCKA